MGKPRPALLTLQEMRAALKATDDYAAMLRETIDGMERREESREAPTQELSGSATSKKPLTKALLRELKEFLRIENHVSIENALEAASCHFCRVQLNEKVVAELFRDGQFNEKYMAKLYRSCDMRIKQKDIRQLRKELGLAGSPGRNAAPWRYVLEGRVDLSKPLPPNKSRN